jgi:ketosteroid isomerase-like protein
VQENIKQAARWSVDAFAAFWANPQAHRVAAVLTQDVRGYWPWSNEPVRGISEYVGYIEKIIAYVPQMRLTVGEHATNGDATFVHWVMHANGANGRFELSGIDRLILRDGLVAENLIRFDSEQLQMLVGRKGFWSS